MLKSVKSILFVLPIVLSPATASAGSPLYDAACEYREAVKQFERDANDIRIVDRYDLKLIDRLEDSTSDLRSRAHHPERLDRLTYAWNEVQSLHGRVESTIFSRTCYSGHPVLVNSWNRVACAYRAVSLEMRRVCGVYGNNHPFGPDIRPPVIHDHHGPRITVPQVAVPRVYQPHNPDVAFPPARAPFPSVPFGSPNHFDRGVPLPTPPLTPPGLDEVRYRQLNRSPVPSHHRVDSRYRAHQVRSAMVGAMLSRLLD